MQKSNWTQAPSWMIKVGHGHMFCVAYWTQESICSTQVILDSCRCGADLMFGSRINWSDNLMENYFPNSCFAHLFYLSFLSLSVQEVQIVFEHALKSSLKHHHPYEWPSPWNKTKKRQSTFVRQVLSLPTNEVILKHVGSNRKIYTKWGHEEAMLMERHNSHTQNDIMWWDSTRKKIVLILICS